MNGDEHIHVDPAILQGKPVVKGTRLSVEFILALFAAGWTQTQVLESYPNLTADSLQAVFAFAAETLREEPFVGIWKDRDDLSDATAWVRRLREQEWRK